MASKRASVPELKVVFDSNALYTGSASYLVNRAVHDLVLRHSAHKDVMITWYLPDVVLNERSYQMQTEASKLLPSLAKLERLLGHNLGITPQIVEMRVKEAADRSIAELGLAVIRLDVTTVDWTSVCDDAAFRRPPFTTSREDGNEKGFRDRVILETFVQLVESSPRTPSRCKLVIVTHDLLLQEAVRQRYSGFTNVRVAADLEELEALINTLVAEVGEEWVAMIREKCATLFFSKGVKDTIYYKDEIRDLISDLYSEQLAAVPEGATERSNQAWGISKPNFVSKQRQRVTWVNRIRVQAVARDVEPLSSPGGGDGGDASLPLNDDFNVRRSFRGYSAFDVTWSVTINAAGNPINPKIEGTRFVESKWDPDLPSTGRLLSNLSRTFLERFPPGGE